jgi:ABC-2 type transport system permease protein
MRGVIEEKTNRIIEVIISSVRPFQLMMGKIVGIALVGLTQFVLWIALTFVITSAVKQAFEKDKYDVKQVEETFKTNSDQSTTQLQKNANMSELSSMLDSINFPIMVAAFIFYFLGGYLLYSALFAAVGAAVDSEADTQQFMLPITIPLVLSFVMAQFIINNPEGPVAFWFSIIPLTSPVIMMVRIPFGVPYYEVILSMVMLVLGFIGTTWLAGRIYRTGILMYGKKVSYRELWKWLFYKA